MEERLALREPSTLAREKPARLVLRLLHRCGQNLLFT